MTATQEFREFLQLRKNTIKARFQAANGPSLNPRPVLGAESRPESRPSSGKERLRDRPDERPFDNPDPPLGTPHLAQPMTQSLRELHLLLLHPSSSPQPPHKLPFDVHQRRAAKRGATAGDAGNALRDRPVSWGRRGGGRLGNVTPAPQAGRERDPEAEANAEFAAFLARRQAEAAGHL
jgi:hypothetical protein